jgi:hypothetical protein
MIDRQSKSSGSGSNRSGESSQNAPSPLDILMARQRAGLSQAAAAELVYLSTPGRWSEYERGRVRMERSRYELFLLLTDQHPKYALEPRKS